MSEKVIKSYKAFDKDMKCRWKQITGYEGLYDVSDNGIVKSIRRVNNSGRSYGKRMIGG